MQTAGRMAQSLDETFGYAPVHVDTIGVGGGVYDRLREQGFPAVPFVASEKATDFHGQKRFANRRAEQWWAFREGMEQGLYDLPPDGEDDLLISQLLSIKYRIRSDGRMLSKARTTWKHGACPLPTVLTQRCRPRWVGAQSSGCPCPPSTAGRGTHPHHGPTGEEVVKAIAVEIWEEPAAFIGLLVTLALLVGAILTDSEWNWETIVAILAPLLTALGIRGTVTPNIKAAAGVAPPLGGTTYRTDAEKERGA